MMRIGQYVNGMHRLAMSKSANARLRMRKLVGVRKRLKCSMMKTTMLLPPESLL